MAMVTLPKARATFLGFPKQCFLIVHVKKRSFSPWGQAHQRPGEHLDNLFRHFWVEVEEVWNVVGEKEEHVRGNLCDSLIVESERR